MKVVLHLTGHIPWAVDASDGLPVKTDKAKLVHVLEIDHLKKTKTRGGLHCS